MLNSVYEKIFYCKANFLLKMPIFWRKRVKNFHFYAFETGMVQPEVSISIFQKKIQLILWEMSWASRHVEVISISVFKIQLILRKMSWVSRDADVFSISVL